MNANALITLTKDTIVARNENNFLTSQIGDEIVMMDLVEGNYIAINKMGSVIWKFLDKPASVTAVINQLTDHFDVEAEQCEHEVLDYFRELIRHKLIIVQQV